MGFDNQVEVLSFTTVSHALFVKVKVNQPNAHLFYWILPDKYIKKTISETEVVKNAKYIGTFDSEVVTFSTVDYFEYVWNTIYISVVTDSCVRRMIKRRFLPLWGCLLMVICGSGGFNIDCSVVVEVLSQHCSIGGFITTLIVM